MNPRWGSGPDGHSRTGSPSDHRPLTVCPARRFPRRRSDWSRHRLLNLAGSHHEPCRVYLVRLGTRLHGLIRLACSEPNPHEAGLLRRQRDDSFVEAAPKFERCDPTAGEIRASRQWPHERAGPVNQYGPNVHIAALGDAAQSSRAATRMLPGNQAQPPRKLSAVLEREMVQITDSAPGCSAWVFWPYATRTIVQG